tara:strand:- start:59050 stop:59328 length:279 start_codon:yes stop_codon:yes gene_type:complete
MKENTDQQSAFEALSFLVTSTGEYQGVRAFVQGLLETASNLGYAVEASLEVCVIFPNLHQSAPAELVFTSDSDLPTLLSELVKAAALAGMDA